MPGAGAEALPEDEKELRSILSLFLKLKQIHQPIRMHNLVEGVPVSFDARVVMVRGDRVVQFSVHRYQVTALDLEQRAVLIGEPFNRPVGARVHSLHFREHVACLKDFYYMESCAVQRNFYRVQIDFKLPVAILTRDTKNFGHVQDLSISGMATRLQPDHGLKPGQPVLAALRVPLFDNGQEPPLIKMKGQVVRVAPQEEFATVALQLMPGGTERNILARFVSHNQKDILKRFKAHVDRMEERFRH